jgi:chromosome segregation ATPase
MDFEFQLEHLDTTHSNQSDDMSSDLRDGYGGHDSAILNDLTKQIEDLQGKLKLSYRKLFLFETENQKLLKDKNFYFYEKNNMEEKVNLITEKMENLKGFTQEIETELIETTEKMKAFEGLTQTQAIDLKRLTKFHAKIQNIIKPYIENLKKELVSQQSENAKLNKVNFQYLELTEALNKTNVELNEKNQLQMKQNEFEKKNIISSYEEQIHFLSKEIVDFQQTIAFCKSEIQRLKKSNETKNFLENEVVKFKRTHSEDQHDINSMKLRLNEVENKYDALVYEKSEIQKSYNSVKDDQESQKMILDTTRKQLAQQIEENEKLELRLKMLERLNTHLSSTTSATQ